MFSIDEEKKDKISYNLADAPSFLEKKCPDQVKFTIMSYSYKLLCDNSKICLSRILEGFLDDLTIFSSFPHSI